MSKLNSIDDANTLLFEVQTTVREMVVKLGEEAATAGDLEMVKLCDEVLQRNDNPDAWQAVEKALLNAYAMLDT